MSAYVLTNSKYKTLDNFINQLEKNGLPGIKNYKTIESQRIIVDGQEAQLIKSSNLDDAGKQQIALTLYLMKGDKIYNIGAISDESGMERYENLIKQSLFTFKFTK
jgi:hypothetical protein